MAVARIMCGIPAVVIVCLAVVLGIFKDAILVRMVSLAHVDTIVKAKAVACPAESMRPLPPFRNITAAEVQAYRQDGVVLLRSILPLDMLAEMQTAVDALVEHPSFLAQVIDAGKGYTMEVMMDKTSEWFSHFVLCNPLVHAAARAMEASAVRNWYTQLFNKEPGVDVPTPWHQDLSFWPLRHKNYSQGPSAEAHNILSFWIPLDEVDGDNGVIEFVKGSHKWNTRFRSVDPSYASFLMDHDAPHPPNIDGYNNVPLSAGVPQEQAPLRAVARSMYEHEVLGPWKLNLGDVIMFNALILHGGGPNISPTKRRRGLTVRYVGDDVLYHNRPGALLSAMPLYKVHLDEGQPLSSGGSKFQQVWPERIPEEKSMLDGVSLVPDVDSAVRMIGTVVVGDAKRLGAKVRDLWR